MQESWDDASKEAAFHDDEASHASAPLMAACATFLNLQNKRTCRCMSTCDTACMHPCR
jgi:hypothetical protein